MMKGLALGNMTSPTAKVAAAQQASIDFPKEPLTEPVANSQFRIAEIDSLRGLAAIGVMAFHFTTLIHREGGNEFYQKLSFEFSYGMECVYLFFMISGFVILLTAARCRNVLDFAVARFARLYPAYWAAIAISCFLIHFTPWLANRPSRLVDAVSNLTMVQSAWGIDNLDGSFWSLYVELSFYVVVACLIVLRRLSWLAGGMLVLSIINALVMHTVVRDIVPGVWRLPVLVPLSRYAHYFCFGIWIYRLRAGWNWRFIPVVIVLWTCAQLHGDGVSSIVIGGIFAAAANGRLPWLSHPVFAFLGTISYSLYLVHQNLGRAVINWSVGQGRLESNTVVLLSSLIAIGVASAVCFTVEKPANHAIRQWWRRRRERETEVMRTVPVAPQL